MSFINPIWLWGLSALAIPVGIHLLSRKEGKTIRIGSIRFLTETSTSKFSSIRLNELLLLAARSALVILIVLFLAGLWIERTSTKASRKWALLEKGLENENHINVITDSLQKNGFEIRTLAADFPVMDNSDTAHVSPDYYKLAEVLSKENDLQAVVLATNSLSGFKGKRNSLPANITWLTVPVSENSLPARTTLDSDTFRITLIYDNEFLNDRKIMLAALNALQNAAPKKISIAQVPVENFNSAQNSDWLISLSNGEIFTDRKLLYFKENVFKDLIERESQNTWILTQHLTVANALEEHLPVRLMEILFQKEIKNQLIKRDTRQVSNELAWSSTAIIQSDVVAANSQPLDKILFACILLLFIAERILAFYRKQ